MGEEDRQFFREKLPGYMRFQANSRGRKQEKMMNFAFVNRVRIPFIFKMVPLEYYALSVVLKITPIS